MEGKISLISGPVVIVKGLDKPKMNNIVLVGEKELIGEIVKIEKERVVVQVYEDTTGVKVGEKVIDTGNPLSVELGPGLIGSIFDGLQRPLDRIFELQGIYIKSGSKVPSLDRKKRWHFIPKVKVGDYVKEGEIIGEVKESSLITHKIMVPIGIKGKVKSIAEEGEYSIEEPIAEIGEGGTKEIKMISKWPVRVPRPFIEKLSPNVPLVTGQRIIDTLFPIAMGGTAAIPGPFGSGKTVMQHQLAKWANADVIVYIGCGERGNEMTEMLVSFPELKDPRTGKPLMDRTILIANTSNMPVAAREASIYTGITIAEYYRDMGYNVAVMADSTSRWAEALREISGRLEEMPGEEGYPAYLGRRLGEFYGRAGKVKTLNGNIGSVTVIGAVSPPGGDFSEPVTQNTLRYTKVFWSLDSSLANSRHFPAINWLDSYSLYKEDLDKWYEDNIGKDWNELREKVMYLLEKENEINQIAKLIGYDSLPMSDKLILFVARMLREDYLQQNAYDEVDTYSSLYKQYKMLKTILGIYDELKDLSIIPLEEIQSSNVVQLVSSLRYTKEEQIDELIKRIGGEMGKIIDKYGSRI